MNFTIDQIKDELVRRLEAGEITREQATVAANKFMAQQQAPQAPVEVGQPGFPPVQPEPDMVPAAPLPDPSLVIGPTVIQPTEPQESPLKSEIRSMLAPRARARRGSQRLPDIATTGGAGIDRREERSGKGEDWERETLAENLDMVTGAKRQKSLDKLFASNPGVEFKQMQEMEVPGWNSAAFYATRASMSPQEVAQSYADKTGGQVLDDGEGNFLVQNDQGVFYLDPGLGMEDIGRVGVTAAREAAITAATGGLGHLARAGRLGVKAAQAARATGRGARLAREGLEETALAVGEQVGDVAAGGQFDVSDAVTGSLAGTGLRGLMPSGGARAKTTVDDGVRDPDLVIGETIGPQPAPKQVAGEPDLPVSDEVKSSGKIARDSVKSKKKRRKFAAMARGNPKAVKLMKKHNMEITPDVVADDDAFVVATMAPRMATGSDASNEWTKVLKNNAAKSDDLLKSIDIQDMPVNASADILDDMNKTKNSLVDNSVKILNKVDEQMPPNTPVLFFNGEDAAATVYESLDERLIDADLKKHLSILEDGEGTYLTLRTMKEHVRKALEKRDGPFSGLSVQSLKDIDAALKADQIDNVAQYMGEDMAASLVEANRSYAKAAEMQKKIDGAFGGSEGSIGRKISSAIKGVGEDDKAIKKLMEDVPEQYHEKMIFSGIFGNSRAKTKGARIQKGGFGFGEFTDTMDGIYKNEGFTKELKMKYPDKMKTLEELYDISKRITRSRSIETRTGKDLAPMVAELEADNFIASLLGSNIGQAVLTMGASKIPVVGSPLSGGMQTVSESVSTGGKRALDELGKLTSSKDFVDDVVNMAEGKLDPDKFAKKTSFNKGFRKWAKAANLDLSPKSLERWILSSMRIGAEQTNAEMEQQDGNANK